MVILPSKEGKRLEIQTPFTKNLRKNVEILCDLMGNSSDFLVRDMMIGSRPAVLCYLNGMVDMDKVQNNVISPLHRVENGDELTPEYLSERVLGIGEVKVIAKVREALDQLLSGSVFLILEGENKGISISLPGWEERSITESKAEPIIRGPQDSFTESLRTNTALVRRRVKDHRVRLTNIKVGEMSGTEVTLMYIHEVADPELVQNLTGKLTTLKAEQVLEGEYLEEYLIGDKTVTIFPLFFNTERPDKVAAGIMDGKVAIFVDGTPFVLLAPTVFIDFFQSAEDYYQSHTYSSLIRILRYFSMAICLLAPAIYVALTSFHQDMIPTVLLLSLSAQREGVPFPAFIEAMIMELIFEVLREAGLRMPRTVGQAVSIVGSIVIGQAAVEANVVSAVMVIVVAITAISSFVIPAYSMAIPIRILRFGFIGIAAMFGVYGVTIGILILIVHLNSLQSFGVPYMSPLAPYESSKQSDSILRFSFRSKSRQSKRKRSNPS